MLCYNPFWIKYEIMRFSKWLRSIFIPIWHNSSELRLYLGRGSTEKAEQGNDKKKTIKMLGLWFEAFKAKLRKKKKKRVSSTKREEGEGGRQQCLTGLTLHPLFPLALLFVLLLELGYQARVHVPGLRNGTLVIFFYTRGTKPEREAVWRPLLLCWRFLRASG